MQTFFDAVNAYLLHHPHLLARLELLFWFKYWCLLILMGIFLFLIYREDWRNRSRERRAAYRLQA